MSDELVRIFADQAAFNAQVRERPVSFPAQSSVTTELVTGLISEAVELLRTTKWKKHRNERRYTTNLAHTHEEIVDIFKYVVSLCDVWGITPEALMDGYWAKSAVVRQRWSEEWVHHHIAGPVILLDLDNVLCDYIAGFGQYLLHELARSPHADKYFNAMVDRIEARQWLDESLFPGDEGWYRSLKHTFRTTGQKRDLPVMPGAYEFLRWCKDHAIVILLTARPIDRYPNMLTDTVQWLAVNHMLPYIDHIWWGADKGKVVQLEELTEYVTFAVDDIRGHCHEYQDHGVRSYWLSPHANHHEELITPVRSFDEIMQREDTHARVQG